MRQIYCRYLFRFINQKVHVVKSLKGGEKGGGGRGGRRQNNDDNNKFDHFPPSTFTLKGNSAMNQWGIHLINFNGSRQHRKWRSHESKHNSYKTLDILSLLDGPELASY